MAKAPVVGAVKTRLCPPLTPNDAAALSAAFLRDTWRSAASLARSTAALSLAGDPHLLPFDVDGAVVWPQETGDLGARIEGAARRGLAIADSVIVIGSDSPGLPVALLSRARRLLESVQAVIGPAIDGGYYLIGLRTCPHGLLDNLPWSRCDTRAATCERLRSHSLTVAEIPTWFDVDDQAGLSLLRTALNAGWLDAPATAATLSSLGDFA